MARPSGNAVKLFVWFLIRLAPIVIVISIIALSYAALKFDLLSKIYQNPGLTSITLLIITVLLYILQRAFAVTLRGGNRRCTSTVSLKGKTVIITGGNSGIGKEAAVDLAGRGARIILACRNKKKAEDAIHEIERRTGNKNVIFRKLELSSFKSVREFADRINDEEDRLDILINNAGIPDTNHDKNKNPLPTEDGLSQSFQINHFSHFLLTHLLLDLLKKSAPSRVINVSSRMHTIPRGLNFTVGDGNIRYPKLTLYNKSKLANVMFTKELSRRMEGTGVTSYAVDPGAIFTSIWEKAILSTVILNMVKPLFWILFCDEKAGAQTTICCAVEGNLKSGGVFFDCRHTTKYVNPLVNDDAMVKKLWDVSAEVTSVKS